MPFTQQTKHGVVFHTADAFTAAGGVAHGFASRLGGVSTGVFSSMNFGYARGDDPEAVLENYKRMADAIGVDPKKIESEIPFAGALLKKNEDLELLERKKHGGGRSW